MAVGVIQDYQLSTYIVLHLHLVVLLIKRGVRALLCGIKKERCQGLDSVQGVLG